MSAEHLPTLLALASAMLFALGGQCSAAGLRYVAPRTGALTSIGAAAAIYWFAAPWLLEAWYWTMPATLLFVAIGFFRPALSANLAVMGVQKLGPTLASTLTGTAPLFAVLFGVLVLGEVLTWPLALGTAGIVAGVMTLSARGRVPVSWPLWALALPLGAAVLRAAAHGLTKLGLDTLPSPYYAGLVAYTVSFVIALGGRAAIDGARAPRPDSRGLAWFGAAGVINGVSILSLNTALGRGEIVAVVPVVSTAPLFSIALTYLVFRREAVTVRVIAAVALVVPSVILIALTRQ